MNVTVILWIKSRIEDVNMPTDVQCLQAGDSLPTGAPLIIAEIYIRDLSKNLSNLSKMNNFHPDLGLVICCIWN